MLSCLPGQCNPSLPIYWWAHEMHGKNLLVSQPEESVKVQKHKQWQLGQFNKIAEIIATRKHRPLH